MQKLTTTIRLKYLSEIISGNKIVEHREIKPYWEKRLVGIEVPFRLRLINGYVARAPEVTVEIRKVVRNTLGGTFDLHIVRLTRYLIRIAVEQMLRGTNRTESLLI